MVDGGNYNGQTDHRHRPHQGGPCLLPRQDRLPAPGHRLCGSRRCAGAVLLRPDRRQPQLAHRRHPRGRPSSAADCAQVEKAVDAVEFRTPPAQCNFQPVLAQNAPAVCPPGNREEALLDNFENGTASADRFIETHTAVVPADFTARDWIVTGALPDERPGRAFFGVDYAGGTCAPGGDESGVLHLDSPQITVPNTGKASAHRLRPLGRHGSRMGRRERQDQRQWRSLAADPGVCVHRQRLQRVAVRPPRPTPTRSPDSRPSRAATAALFQGRGASRSST